MKCWWTLVEIVGTSKFGSTTNVVNISLAKMKRERKTLYLELSVIDKISKYLDVKPNLSYQMKNHLTNSQKAAKIFSLQQ